MFGKKKQSQEFKEKEAKLQKQLEEAKQTKDELSELAAQELRSPLVRLQKLIQTTLDNSSDAKLLKETLEKTLAEVTDYKSVIDDLYIIARTNLYKEFNLFVPIDLTQATKEVAEKFINQAKEKEITLNLNLDTTFTHPAHATYYRKMIFLLMDNALKFTPKGGTVQVSLVRDKNYLVLLIEDTGPGMEPEEISKALKRFHRLEKSRREGIAGYGLGLSIAQWIARLHQTDLDVTSMTDKGSKFQVRFSLKN